MGLGPVDGWRGGGRTPGDQDAKRQQRAEPSRGRRTRSVSHQTLPRSQRDPVTRGRNDPARIFAERSDSTKPIIRSSRARQARRERRNHGLEPFPLRLNQANWDKKALNHKVRALPDRRTGPTLARSALAEPKSPCSEFLSTLPRPEQGAAAHRRQPRGTAGFSGDHHTNRAVRAGLAFRGRRAVFMNNSTPKPFGRRSC